MVCTLKVENVVKPPSKPVIVACLITGLHTPGIAAMDSAAQAPIAAEPLTLTASVPQGKPLPASRVTASVISCRNTPPAALPIAIAAQVDHPAPAIATPA